MTSGAREPTHVPVKMASVSAKVVYSLDKKTISP